MTAIPRSPRVISVSWKEIKVDVPSLSNLGELQSMRFLKGGGYDCVCRAYYWASMKGQMSRKCRHYNRCTLKATGNPIKELEEALEMLKDKKVPMEKVWEKASICAMPLQYSLTEIHCKKCTLYPNWCNKHIITFSTRKSKKPMIWRIQTALLNNRRKDAKSLLRKYIKLVRAVRNEPRRN